MTVVAWVATLVAAAMHVLVFIWETLLFTRPGVHRGVFGISSADVPAARLWAFNVGFYNPFLGVGAATGVVLWMTGNPAAGRPLVIYTCAFIALAGGALFVSDRMGLGRERGTGVGGAIAQSTPGLIGLVAALLAG